MIYLKRLWNLIAIIFGWCVFSFTAPLSVVIEIFIITPILYILTNEIYFEKYEPLSVRITRWLMNKLIF